MKDLTTAARLLEAERDENVERLDMAPTEKVALAVKLKELVAPEAATRKGQRTDLQHPGQFAPDVPETRDLVAKAVDMSPRSLGDAERVVAAMDDPDPDVAAVGKEAAAEMDATGKVNPAAQKVREVKARKGGSHANPNMAELIGRAGDVLKKTDVALARFEKMAGDKRTKAVRDKAAEYADAAEGLATRLRDIAGPR